MNYSIQFHPLASRDIDAITRWIIEYADAETAERKLAEIERTFASLVRTPHKGLIRNEVAPGLRAIPAGRKAVIVRDVVTTRRRAGSDRDDILGSA